MAENTFILKPNHGADVMAEIEKFVVEKQIDYCFIVGASGRLKDFEMVSSDGSGIGKAKFPGEYEISAISGKIEKGKGGKYSTNIRVSISSSGFSPRAGQLISAKAGAMLEIAIRKVDMKKIIM